MSSFKCSLVMHQLDSDTSEEIRKYFKGMKIYNSFVRIGRGYLFPKSPNIKEQMDAIYKMPIRANDIFVATFPRSGTTWTQEMVWLIANDLDYSTARSKHLVERYATLGSFFVNPHLEVTRLEEYKKRNCVHLDKLVKMISPPTDILDTTLGPRFIKTHIALSMLPPDLLESARVVYVARDPRDVAVSLYHLSKLLATFEFQGDFKLFWDFFTRGLIIRSPYFEQVKEAWARKDHPNMLFLFYEDILRDLPSTIRKVSDFLGKKLTNDQIACLCEHLHIDNFKRNQSVNLYFLKEFDALIADQEPFIRKGKSCWRDYFDREMTKQAAKWIEDNLRDTDLKFPII